MITDATVDELYNILLNILDLPANRDTLQARMEKLDTDKETERFKCVALMHECLKLLKSDTRVIYVVAQQTPHGGMLHEGRFYTDEALAIKEVEYWERAKCNWMKRFRLELATDVKEYMKPK